ncbi:hypothetical protein SAMN05444678_11686 [Sphingomonas sp. YR710]|uniref:hypothetical protein n=1 Tax=Sphingomonas sp. YR710 TaxID=1882773 RepID=UPI0008842151|nr:hypothetical protein [Sphingomonas sp. YR710]SDD58576.1 hypothetical protein SAMN05444678_11686 [Sphingomonas sp. YR710]
MDAPSNVVRLPTAAPRKPNNHRFKEQRAAGYEAKQASVFRERYINPRVRAVMGDAETIMGIEQTPALLIASALFALADPDTQQKAMEQLAPGAVVGRKAHIQAIATMRRLRATTIGEQYDFYNAIDELEKRRS